MRSPLVPRALYDAAIASRDALRDEIGLLRVEHAKALSDEQRRHDETRARLYEVTGRAFDITEQMTAPKPVTVQAPAPEFNSFPPKIASALAMATAGFKKDDVRRIYAWVQGEIDNGTKADDIAATLRNGLPVSIEPEELH